MMADLNVALILRLVDRATGPAKSALRTLESQSRRIASAGREQIAMSAQQIGLAQVRSQNLLGEAAAIAATGYAMVRALQPAINFEAALADVSKVIDFKSENGIRLLGDDIQKLVTSGGLAMTAEGVAAIVAAVGQAGLINENLPDTEKTRQLLEFAEAAGKMGVAFGIPAEQAGQSMAKWRDQMGLSQDQAELLGDAVNHLSNKIGASAPGMVDVIARTGALAKAAGLSTEEIAALTAVFVKAAPSPEIAATAMKNFTGTLVAGESMTKAQMAIMDRLGIQSTDLAKRMGTDAKGAILEVMSALSKLPAYEQTAALSRLFGEESIAGIAPLLTNIDGLGKAFGLTSAQSQYSGSMLEEYLRISATTSANLRVTQNWITRLAETIGTNLLPMLNEMLATAMPFIEMMIMWAKENPELIKTLGWIAASLFAMRLSLLGLRLVLQPLHMAFWLLNGALGTGAWLFGKAGMAVVRLMPVINILGRAVIWLGRAFLMAGRLLLANPIIAVITAIAGLAYVIYQNWDGFTGYFTDKIDRVRAAFDAGLLNGVLRLLSEFNPFKLMIDGAIALLEYLTGWDLSGVKAALYDAFGINLFDKGVEMILSLWEGMKTVIGQMTAWLVEKLSAVTPSWMRASYGAAGVDAGPSGSSSTGEDFDFSGGRATGGPVRRGMTYNVGENGVERFTANLDGWIIPNRHVAGGARGGGTSINLGGITINASSGMSPQMIARAVSDEIERRAREGRFALNDGGAYA